MRDFFAPNFEVMDTDQQLLHFTRAEVRSASCGRTCVLQHWALGGIHVATLNGEVNLAIGNVAPDFTTKDAEGVEFKLSDYRGKVVMLDFWGDW